MSGYTFWNEHLGWPELKQLRKKRLVNGQRKCIDCDEMATVVLTQVWSGTPGVKGTPYCDRCRYRLLDRLD